jgi:hypothetical protein
LPPDFTCEIRAQEYGLFKAWSECEDLGLSLTYTSWARDSEGQCINNATDVALTKDQILGNEEMCELIITVSSSPEAQECNYVNVLTSELAKMKNFTYLALILLILNYV